MNNTRKFKILFISQYFHPERFSNNKVVEKLCALGHEVEVISAIPNYPNGKYFEGYGPLKRRNEVKYGASVRRCLIVPRGSNGLMLALNYFSFVIFASWEAWKKRNSGFDIVFSSAPSPLTIALPGIFLAKRKKIPHIFWVQDVWPQTPIALLSLKNGPIVRALTRLCRYIYRNVDCLLIPSQAYREKIESLQPDCRYHHFPNTLETYHQMSPEKEELRKKHKIAEHTFIAMYAGNIGKGQKTDALVEAAKTLRSSDLVFVIVGGGRALPSLQEKIKRANCENMFVFVGQVSPEEVTDYLSIANCAIMTLAPDPVFDSVVPLRVQTFLGCGKPIIAHLRGETARIVRDAGCGVVSDPDDDNKLIENIKYIMNLPLDEIATLGKRARNYAVANFAEEIVYKDLERLMEGLCQKEQKTESDVSNSFA